jgi:hypothetical protein
LLLCYFHWNPLKSFLWTFLLPPLKLKCRNLERAPCTLNSIKQLKDWWRLCYHLCWQHGLEAQRSIWSSYKHCFVLEESLGRSLNVIFKCFKVKNYFSEFLFFFFLLTKVSWIVASKWYYSSKKFSLMNNVMVLDVHYCGHVIIATKYFNFFTQCLSWNISLIVFL